MYEELKYMARTGCHLVENGNFLKLLINRQSGELNLSFREKPPAHIRSHLRFIGFNWSRKNRHWHSCLNNIQLKRVRKFYKDLIKNR